MANTADIKAVITAEDKASAVLKNFGDNANLVGGKLSSVAELAAKGLAVAGTAAVGFGVLSLKAFAEAQEQTAQLNQVLNTTGKISQISTKQVEDLAMSMEHYSGKTHVAIEQGQVILLQFSEITSKNLPLMTKAMVDLSQRMGMDMPLAAKTLGIALDDPTTGMARLRKGGIDFTATQKDMIKSLQESGDIAGADAILMQGLQQKVGGAAGAYRNTLGGALESVKSSFKDFQEAVGLTINKYLGPLAEKAALALSKVNWVAVMDQTVAAIRRFWGELLVLYGHIKSVYDTLSAFFLPSLHALADTIETRLLPPIIKLWNTLEPGLTEVLKVVGAIVGVTLVAAMWLFINILNIGISIIGGVIGVISQLIAWFGNLIGAGWNMVNAVIGAFRGLYNGISGAIGGVIGAVSGAISRTVSAIWGFFGQFVDAGWGLIKAFASGILGASEIPVNAAKSVLSKVRNLLPFSDAKEGPLSDLTKSGKKFSETFAGGMIQGKGLVSSAGAEVLGSITTASPNSTSQSSPAYNNPSGSPSPINVSFSGIFTGSEQEFRKLAIKVFQAGADAASMQNLDVSAMTTQHWRRI